MAEESEFLVDQTEFTDPAALTDGAEFYVEQAGQSYRIKKSVLKEALAGRDKNKTVSITLADLGVSSFDEITAVILKTKIRDLGLNDAQSYFFEISEGDVLPVCALVTNVEYDNDYEDDTTQIFGFYGWDALSFTGTIGIDFVPVGGGETITSDNWSAAPGFVAAPIYVPLGKYNVKVYANNNDGSCGGPGPITFTNIGVL